MQTDLIDHLRNIDTPTLANAIESLNLQNRMTGFCDRRLRQLTPEMGVLCGHALTLQAETAVAEPCSREAGVEMYIEVCRALEQMPKPAIVVIEEFGPHAAFSAHIGEVLATLFQRFGAIGVVSDAAIRDLNELRALGFQAFAPGTVASHANFAIRRVGIPVRICGLTVSPGDLLHGDENGLIRIPERGRDRLPALAEAIRTKEKVILEYLKEPSITLEGIRERLTH